jgi:hypothetical protein
MKVDAAVVSAAGINDHCILLRARERQQDVPGKKRKMRNRGMKIRAASLTGGRGSALGLLLAYFGAGD